MIIGIGLDIIEISRITDAYEKNNQFADRILTSKELGLFQQYSKRRQMEFLAGRFAAKEAYAKAVGTGIGALRFTDMEIDYTEKGAPIWSKPNQEGHRVYLSITHTKSTAAAQVIIEADHKN